MENQSTMSVSLKYGLIASIVLAAWSMLSSLMGWNDPSANNSMFKWLRFLIQAGVMFWAITMTMKYVRDLINSGNISFGGAMKAGLLTVLVIAVFMGLFTYVYFQFIDPDFISQMLDMTRERLEDKGMDEEAIEKAMSMSSKMMGSGPMAFFSFLGSMFFGLILSLIGAFIHKSVTNQDYA